MKFYGLLVLSMPVLVPGCGYTLGYRAPPSVRTVAVPLFQNVSFPLRREIEHDLTSAVRKEIQSRTSLILTDAASADLVIFGTIREFREPVIAEGPSDEETESLLIVSVSLIVEDYINARRSDVDVRVREPFSDQLGETIEAARGRALKNLSERIVLAVESWEEG